MINTVELGGWVKRLNNIANIELETAEKIREISTPFVPFLSGHLSNSTEVIQDDMGAHLLYTELYAHYQYVGVGFKHTTTFHPQATEHWVERALEANPGALEKFVKGKLLNG